MTYTITKTRRQICIETSDGQRWLYPRSNTGLARANRKLTALESVGYVEEQPTPDTFTQLVEMARTAQHPS